MEDISTHPNLLNTLLNSAEKASNIARCCRADANLLALLTQEKGLEEANQRFERDFKTLADVLIQETIRHDVGKLFPDLKNSIKGEESSIFTNTLGESVSVTIGATQSETAECLNAVLNGNRNAAEALAAEAHRDVIYTDPDIGDVPDLSLNLNFVNLGMWIDPIDATAEYISGGTDPSQFPHVSNSGLKCVTVLIGVFDRYTNEPVIGVVSQPFHEEVEYNKYKSKVYWGVALPNIKSNNCHKLVKLEQNIRLAIYSKSENEQVIQSVEKIGFKSTFSAGAGYKALKVITGDANLFILSKNTSFKWDTCAPQAILRSLGGNIYDLKSIKQGKLQPLKYFLPSSKTGEDWKRNQDGIVAIRNIESIDEILKLFTNQ